MGGAPRYSSYGRSLIILCVPPRLLDDLVLWEPLAPAPLDTHEAFCTLPPPGCPTLLQPLVLPQDDPMSFSMCKSGIKEESSSGEEDSGHFYSIYDPKSRSHRRLNMERVSCQSKMCVSLNIGKGMLRAAAAIKVGPSHLHTPLHLSPPPLDHPWSFFAPLDSSPSPKSPHSFLG